MDKTSPELGGKIVTTVVATPLSYVDRYPKMKHTVAMT